MEGQISGGVVGKLSKKELRKQKRNCYSPQCKHRAFLKDWAGWNWCLHHWWWHKFDKRSTGYKHPLWLWIKWTKIF